MNQAGNQAGQRRSPQTFDGLFKGLNIVNFDPDHAALFISLCQCTGWSAERIGSVFFRKTNVWFSAEEVYTFFWAWYRNRNRQDPSRAEIGTMLYIIQKSQVGFSGIVGRPLNETAQPKTVTFNPRWSPKVAFTQDLLLVRVADLKQEDDEALLCPGFDGKVRTQAKDWLRIYRRYPEKFATLSPAEQMAIIQFGPPMEQLIVSVMRNWGADFRAALDKDDGSHRLDQNLHVGLVVQHLEKYVEAFENKFGKMAEPTSQEIPHGGVVIHCTGYGVKIFLGMMMTDRILVMDRARAEKLNLPRVEIHDVPLNEEGAVDDCAICWCEIEDPVWARACCRKYFCVECLKRQLSTIDDGVRRTKCPHCCYVFPIEIIHKLFGGEQQYEAAAIEERLDDDEDGENSMSDQDFREA